MGRKRWDASGGVSTEVGMRSHTHAHTHTHLALLENPVNPEDVVKHFIEQY